MASIPDVVLSNQWADIYDATGIAVGTAIYGTNKTASPLLVWEGATAPPDESYGVPVRSYESFSISASSPGVWVFGKGPVVIQEA